MGTSKQKDKQNVITEQAIRKTIIHLHNTKPKHGLANLEDINKAIIKAFDVLLAQQGYIEEEKERQEIGQY